MNNTQSEDKQRNLCPREEPPPHHTSHTDSQRCGDEAWRQSRLGSQKRRHRSGRDRRQYLLLMEWGSRCRSLGISLFLIGYSRCSISIPGEDLSGFGLKSLPLLFPRLRWSSVLHSVIRNKRCTASRRQPAFPGPWGLMAISGDNCWVAVL